tara:strand:+ start:273 stop:437 length:165 start_codon:yes stop_codon:yes gene_type:complete
MANPLYGSNKNDEALDAIAKAIDGGVTSGDPGEEDSYIVITIDGVDYNLHLTAA